MAVGDGLFLLAWLSSNISRLSGFKLGIYPNGTSRIIVFKIARFLLYVSMRECLITLMVISIERFRATRRTLTISQPYTFRRRATVICICWLIPLPIAAYLSYLDCCGLRIEDILPFHLADIMIIVLQCCVTVVLSIITIRRLSRPQAIQAHLSQQQVNLRRRRTQAAAKMVLLSVLLYTCCWLPTFVDHIFSVIGTLTQRDVKSIYIDWVSFHFIVNSFLPAANSLFSPLIYLICLPDFRQAAKKVLCRRNIQNQAPNRQN